MPIHKSIDARKISFQDLMAQAAQVAQDQAAAHAKKVQSQQVAKESLEKKKEASVRRRDEDVARYEQRRQHFDQQRPVETRQRPVETKQRPVETKQRPLERHPTSKTVCTALGSLPRKGTKNVKSGNDLSFDQLMRKAQELATEKKATPSTSETQPYSSGDRRSVVKGSGSREERLHLPTVSGKVYPSLERSVLRSKESVGHVRPIMRPKEPLARGMGVSGHSATKRDRETSLLSIRSHQSRPLPMTSAKMREELSGRPRSNREELSTRTRPMREELSTRTKPMREELSGRTRPMREETPIRRMPFMPFNARRIPRQPRSLRKEEERDEELDSFIVDDDEEEGRYHNDISSEIGRIFRYDKSRYTNDPYSDDDMEADASEVLREEKRSERIGRKEDLREERLEMERAQKRKKLSSNKNS